MEPYPEVRSCRKSYRGRLPKPYSRGYYRPEVGGKRFTVGNKRDVSEREVLRRVNALRELFERQCELDQIDSWAVWVLPWSKRIAAGGELRFEVSDDAKANVGQATEEFRLVALLRDIGVKTQSDDPDTIGNGERQIKQWLDERINTAVTQAVEAVRQHANRPADLEGRIYAHQAFDPANCETRTLHEALEAYASHIKVNGEKQDNGLPSPSVQQYIRWAAVLKQVHEDLPFWRLDRNQLDSLFGYWRNRSISDHAHERISGDHSKYMMDCLWVAIVWIDEACDWKWELPKGARRIKRTPARLDSDRKKARTRRVSRNTYSPEQLPIMARELDTFGKLILGLLVNCAMQPAEVGRFEIADHYDSHPEPGQSGNWTLFDRPKTHEYGEWLLWSEVSLLLQLGIERASILGAERVIVGPDGKSWH